MTTATNENKIPAYTWVVMGIPWVFVVLGALLNFAIGVMLPSMQEELGFNAAQAGWLSGISWILTAVLTIPITFLVNKIGPKMLLVAVLIFAGVALIINGMSQTFAVLFVTRAIALTLVVGVTPALTLLKNMWVPLTRITTVNGVEAFMNPLGQVMSTALVPALLVALAGWRPVFFIVGAIVLALGVAWIFLGRERKTEAYLAATKGGGGFKDLAAAMKQPSIWLLALGWPGTTLVWIAFFTFWPTYATDVLGITLAQAGFVLSMLPIGSMIASLVSPIVCEKVGIDKPFIWMWGFILPFCYYGMLLHASLFVLGLASFLAGVGAFWFVAPGISLPFKLRGIKPQEVAMGIGIMISIITLGGAAGGIVAGNIFQSTGDLYKALAICCLSPLTMGIFGLFLPERGRKQLEKEAREAQAPTP
jgi:predicted MFS family arabinose efflux permease